MFINYVLIVFPSLFKPEGKGIKPLKLAHLKSDNYNNLEKDGCDHAEPLLFGYGFVDCTGNPTRLGRVPLMC